jgi:hypothetical protein
MARARLARVTQAELRGETAMERAIYKSLPMTRMTAGVTVEAPGAYAPKPVRADSPAIEAMTDFRQVAAATIRANATIAQATQLMIARGVRLLIAVDAERAVLGLITARDTMGERPINLMRERGLVHGELTVAGRGDGRHRCAATYFFCMKNT